ncbi:MAG: hypothetical protein U0800_03530 [Isosphaeraceae bacterium]
MTLPIDDLAPIPEIVPPPKVSRQGQGGGPKTVFGKEASSKNATTHGLSARLIRTLPDHFGLEVDDRLKFYVAYHQPRTDNDMDLCGQAAIAFVQHRESFREKYFYLQMRSQRAQASWQLDREADAALLGFRLAKRPSVVAAELRKSLHGALWMLERWGYLQESLDVVGLWREEEVQRAYDLLGRDEVEREHDPDRVSKGTLEERKALVAAQVRILKDLAEGPLKELDAEQRQRAIDGDMYLDDPILRRIDRYGQRAFRINRDCLAELERRRIGRGLEAYNPDGSIASPPPRPGDPPRGEPNPNDRPVFFRIDDPPQPAAAEKPQPIRNEPRAETPKAPNPANDRDERRPRPSPEELAELRRQATADLQARRREQDRARAERKAAKLARKRNR